MKIRIDQLNDIDLNADDFRYQEKVNKIKKQKIKQKEQEEKKKGHNKDASGTVLF